MQEEKKHVQGRLTIIFASGYYPTTPDKEFTEDYPTSEDTFFTRLCKDWEASASLPENIPTRQVIIRVGVVLGKDGGMIKDSIWPFWMGVGGEWSPLIQ